MPFRVLVLYLSNTHFLFLSAKNPLFELSRLLGVVTSRHACRGLSLRTTKTITEKGIPLRQGARLGPDGAMRSRRRMKFALVSD